MADIIVELSTLGAIGTFYTVPGLIAAIMGVIWFWLLYYIIGRWVWIVTLVQIVLAIWITAVGERVFAVKDPGAVILDEFVAVNIIFLSIKVPRTFKSILAVTGAFILFLLVDATKPLGINYVELLPFGVGIVGDDVVAAVMARAVLLIFEKKETIGQFLGKK